MKTPYQRVTGSLLTGKWQEVSLQEGDMKTLYQMVTGSHLQESDRKSPYKRVI